MPLTPLPVRQRLIREQGVLGSVLEILDYLLTAEDRLSTTQAAVAPDRTSPDNRSHRSERPRTPQMGKSESRACSRVAQREERARKRLKSTSNLQLAMYVPFRINDNEEEPVQRIPHRSAQTPKMAALIPINVWNSPLKDRAVQNV
jgi:hypothetical protein